MPTLKLRVRESAQASEEKDVRNHGRRRGNRQVESRFIAPGFAAPYPVRVADTVRLPVYTKKSLVDEFIAHMYLEQLNPKLRMWVRTEWIKGTALQELMHQAERESTVAGADINVIDQRSKGYDRAA